VKSSVGSSAGTRDELGTSRWPRAEKNVRNRRRISADSMAGNIWGRGKGGGQNRRTQRPIFPSPLPPSRFPVFEQLLHQIPHRRPRIASSREIGEEPPFARRSGQIGKLGGAPGRSRAQRLRRIDSSPREPVAHRRLREPPFDPP